MRSHLMTVGLISVSLTLALSACSDGAVEYGVAEPANSEERAAFGESVTDNINYKTDMPVVEYLCHNAIGSACPADIGETLESYYTGTQRTRLDMVDAFARYRASIDLGDPGALISDRDYVEAAYQVTFGRELDSDGGATNLALVQSTGERKTVLRSLLQSQEFSS